MFCDEVKLELAAGRGGAGALSFRKEKYVPYGGPDGGDGGRGGDVILIVDNNIHTLADYKSQKVFRAENGHSGQKKKMHGRDGEDLYLKIPPGTLVYEAENKLLLADMTDLGERFVVVEGGRGGYGNAHFTSSTRKTPGFAEKGEPGASKTVILELKMIAEVAIIGLPSAGKSTLIASVSNAKPKIADYPFTTLVPNLGVVNLERFGGNRQDEFVVADVPGLIAGASEGKGLGHAFLKHVQRTKLMIHLVDGLLEKPAANVLMIEGELCKFDPELAKRPTVLVINKIDVLGEKQRSRIVNALRRRFPERKIFSVSAATGEGLRSLIFAVWSQITTLREQEKANLAAFPVETKPQILRPLLEIEEKKVAISRLPDREDKRVFRLRGKRLEQIVIMSDLNNPQALDRIYDVLKKMGIVKRLISLGAHDGDILLIGGDEIEFLDILR